MHSDGYQRNLFRRILNLVFKVPAEFIPADTSSIGDSPRTAGSRMQRARARRMAAACAHGARTNAGNATAEDSSTLRATATRPGLQHTTLQAGQHGKGRLTGK